MILEKLLKDVSVGEFLERFLFMIPFAQPHGAESIKPLGTWDRLEAILDSEEPDILIARGGVRWSGDEPVDPDQARDLYSRGYTVLVRHAERHDERLGDLARAFRLDFGAPVNIHLYCTPAGAHGFGWHYDAEEVFIIQTVGRKRYLLRKNTVNPWPLKETLPMDMQYERETSPKLDCELAAGDWLYIPSGYWHFAEASENSVSLAIGVMAPPAIQTLDFLRGKLLHSLLWRRRLPITGEANGQMEGDLLEQFQRILGELGNDVSNLFETMEFAREFQKHLKNEAEGE